MVFAEKEEESWRLEVFSPPAPLPCPAQDFEFPLIFFRLRWNRERKSFPDAILKFVSFFAKHLGVPFKKDLYIYFLRNEIAVTPLPIISFCCLYLFYYFFAFFCSLVTSDCFFAPTHAFDFPPFFMHTL